MKMPSPSSETVMPVHSSAKSRSRRGRSSFTCPIVSAAMLVAIDGPAGAGKSTVARAVASALGFTYLDSGAMYRCVALAAIRAGVDAHDAPEVGRLARELRIEFADHRVLLDGEDVAEEIRAPAVTSAASRVSVHPEVREAMVARQRALIENGDYVA